MGVRCKKMHKSSTNGSQSERLLEEAQEQVDIPDFGDTFLASLYSNRAWDDTIGGGGASKTKEHETEDCLTHFYSPVYSVGKEPIGTSESLKIVEMYVRKDTPFEWTGECMDLDQEKKIEAYNSIATGMEITLHKDGINFGGPVRVNMDLDQPIEVVERVVSPPVQNTVNQENSTDTLAVKITSVLLPQNTTELVDVVSKTTAKQMIVKVLKNLRMVNLPRAYALYEYEPQIDETAGTLTKKLTRIADDACPLKVVLNWPIPHSGRALVLQIKERYVQKSTNEDTILDAYSKVAGLNKDQVDVENEKKSETGLFETTLSGGAPSKPDGEWRGGVMCFILVFLFCLLVYCVEANAPKEQDSSTVRGFLEKYLDEFLKKFLEELEKSKLRIVSQIDTSPNPQ